jgi:hypothetical protein
MHEYAREASRVAEMGKKTAAPYLEVDEEDMMLAARMSRCSPETPGRSEREELGLAGWG